ncbi:MAG TPA: hypothetical protein VJP79_01780 [Nitrososphaera sp.]|nr:hypothetical protein [Nitrososphaera sp.]
MMLAIGSAAGSLALVVAAISSWDGSGAGQDASYSGASVPVASLGAALGTPSSDAMPQDTSDEAEVASAAGSGEPDSRQPDEVEVEPRVVPAAMNFTDSNFGLLFSDPDKYANGTAAISGKVYEIIDESHGSSVIMTLRIHARAVESDDARVMILFQEIKRPGTTPPKFVVDDCMSLQGVIRGGIGDLDSLGRPLTIPVIDASSLQSIECIDSAMPAKITIDSNQTQSYAGVSLELERAQLADGHLRIKIKANNAKAGENVFVREKESVAEYGDRQYHSLSHLPMYGIYRLDSTIPANHELSGYLFFEPIEDYGGDPITFKIVVEKVGISESIKSTFILRT